MEGPEMCSLSLRDSEMKCFICSASSLRLIQALSNPWNQQSAFFETRKSEIQNVEIKQRVLSFYNLILDGPPLFQVLGLPDWLSMLGCQGFKCAPSSAHHSRTTRSDPTATNLFAQFFFRGFAHPSIHLFSHSPSYPDIC